MTRYETNDRGQIAPLLAVVAVAAGIACFALGRFAASAIDAAQARTAADAAALAAAATGAETTAREVALLNGGRLTSFERAGADVRVRVRVGEATASARARGHHGNRLRTRRHG